MMPCFQTQHMHAPVSQHLPGRVLAALDSKFPRPFNKEERRSECLAGQKCRRHRPTIWQSSGGPRSDCTSGLERLGCLDPRSASVAPGAEGLLRMHLLVHPAHGLGILTLAAGAMAAAVADRGLHGKEAPARCSTVPRALLVPAAAR